MIFLGQNKPKILQNLFPMGAKVEIYMVKKIGLHVKYRVRSEPWFEYAHRFNGFLWPFFKMEHPNKFLQIGLTNRLEKFNWIFDNKFCKYFCKSSCIPYCPFTSLPVYTEYVPNSIIVSLSILEWLIPTSDYTVEYKTCAP